MKYRIKAKIEMFDDNYNPIDEVDMSYVKAILNRNEMSNITGQFGSVELYCPVDKELYEILSEYIPEKI